MIEEEENSHLDESLRHVFSDFHLPPGEGVWGDIEQQLGDGPAEPPRKRRRPLPLPLLLPLALLLGLVGGWLLPRPGTTFRTAQVASSAGRSSVVGSSSAALGQRQAAQPLPASAAPTLGAAVPAATAAAQPAPLAQATTQHHLSASQLVRGAIVPSAGSPAGSPLPTILLGTAHDSVRSAQPAETQPTGLVVTARGLATDSVPGVVRPLVALTRASLAQLHDTAAPAESRQLALVRSLRAEKSELLRLQRRVDSLLLALGAVPLANPQAQAAAPLLPAPDTVQLQPRRRWSLLLAATPEQNYQQFQAAGTDTLQALRRSQERGRRGVNAMLLAEYRLDNRLSVGFGLGYNRTGTELRVAERRTDIGVRYDTTLTHTVSVFTSINQTYSIRLEQIPQLNPVFNPSGQVIRYDTVFITRPDTVFTTIVQNDTVRTTNKTVTPLLDKRTTTTYKTLTPTYHFATLPFLLRYRLTAAPDSRWWADVAVGGQFQFFLGGSQLVTEDGRTFRTERVRVAEGPFRPLNLSLTGSLGVNYALLPRLSLSLAPTLRWQALSVYKPETGLRQRSTATGLQIGARWQF
ncbi:PorT family protein [Hymenobacter sp. 15J16-1T3B]|uniref:PorT family protein n=1 Tax=Hymenobacter sp. 15J16-1T3B TaxID=2886941 RepID=UPI001D0FCA2D|nr:PorT family protein [Hymenobacter sp. 15J16-1T3B]MCC3159932.1 PorT family protein [Hymenobacter sp. 15J16-1T3B]